MWCLTCREFLDLWLHERQHQNPSESLFMNWDNTRSTSKLNKNFSQIFISAGRMIKFIYLCCLRTCMAKAWRVGLDFSHKLQLNWRPERCLLSMCCFTLVDQLDWYSHNRQRQFPSESLVMFWLTISSISRNKLRLKGFIDACAWSVC